MNLSSFFSKAPPIEQHNQAERSFTDEQLKLLESIKATEWLHANVQSAITSESTKHLEDMRKEMARLGITEDGYNYFKNHHHLFDKTAKDLMH